MAITFAESDIAEIASQLEFASSEVVLREVVERFSPDVAMSCSFGGPSGLIMVDQLARMNLLDRVEVYYLDTGLLFAATHEARERIERQYGFEAIAYRPQLSLVQQASLHGNDLWDRDPDKCCGIRKVAPNAEALVGKSAWITGVRRDQSVGRVETPVLAWNARFRLVKVAPLRDWSEEKGWEYVRQHQVPYNALHEDGYPSLGCNTVCTVRPESGESLRAGRWRGHDKTECGLHDSP